MVDKALRSEPPGQSSVLHLEAVREKGKRFVEQLSSHCYAFCFCREHDLLSQWRAYGAGAAGFEIESDRVRLEGYLASKSSHVGDPMPILYGKRQVKGAAGRFMSEASAIAAKPEHSLKGADLTKFNDEFGFLLFLLSLATKDPHFSEEKEWRILQVDLKEDAVRFRPAHGIIIPHLELSGIPPEVFVSVTLGPGVPEFVAEPLRLFLKCNGLEHVQVRHSEIPLRVLS